MPPQSENLEMAFEMARNGANLRTAWEFRRFPTLVGAPRASASMPRIIGGACCGSSSSTAPAYEKAADRHCSLWLPRQQNTRAHAA